MKRIIFLLISFSLTIAASAQTDPTPQETARNFMRSGDWDNAILVSRQALQMEPGSRDLQKDLAMSYLYKRDFANALETVKPMMDRDDADVVTYQIGGNVYKALEMV